MSFHYYTPLSFPSRTPSAIFCLFACILEKYVLLVCVRAFLMYEMGIDFTCPFPICAITRFLGSIHGYTCGPGLQPAVLAPRCVAASLASAFSPALWPTRPPCLGPRSPGIASLQAFPASPRPVPGLLDPAKASR